MQIKTQLLRYHHIPINRILGWKFGLAPQMEAFTFYWIWRCCYLYILKGKGVRFPDNRQKTLGLPNPKTSSSHAGLSNITQPSSSAVNLTQPTAPREGSISGRIVRIRLTWHLSLGCVFLVNWYRRGQLTMGCSILGACGPRMHKKIS